MKTNQTKDVNTWLANSHNSFENKKKKKDYDYQSAFNTLNCSAYIVDCQDYYPAEEACLVSVYLACDLQVIHGSWMLQWPGAMWS